MPIVQLNKKVPAFTLESSEGGTFRLSDFKGKTVVIYFYPKDSTPGCTTQAEDFTAMKAQFSRQNTKVFGISRDNLASHQKFIKKQGLKIPLLSDPDEKVCNLFDVIKEKNMYGKKVMGIERSTFVIGPDQKLVREWRKVKAAGHAQEVLQELKEMNKASK